MTKTYLVKSEHLQLQFLLIQFLSAVFANSNSSMAENSTQPSYTATNQVAGKIGRLKNVFQKWTFLYKLQCENFHLIIAVRHFSLKTNFKAFQSDQQLVFKLEKRVCIHKWFDFVTQFLWFIENLKHMLISITSFISPVAGDDLRASWQNY